MEDIFSSTLFKHQIRHTYVCLKTILELKLNIQKDKIGYEFELLLELRTNYRFLGIFQEVFFFNNFKILIKFDYIL